MPEYLSPGVYVEEVPSAIKPIAGVSTSTACFLGIVPDELTIPVENPDFDPTGRSKQVDPNKPDPKKRYIETKLKFCSDDEIKAKSDATLKARTAFEGGVDAKEAK